MSTVTLHIRFLESAMQQHGPAVPIELSKVQFPHAWGAQENERLCTVLGALITHIDGRIHYIETRRASFTVIASGILATSVAILTLTLANVQFLPTRSSLIFGSTAGMLLSLVIWSLYALQTNFQYPWVPKTDTWKWFYRDSYPPEMRDAFSSSVLRALLGNHFYTSREASGEAWRMFQTHWLDFANKQISLVSGHSNENAEQDLRQVYALHATEYYKNQFLKQLRTALLSGLVVIVVVSLLGWLVGHGLQKGPYNRRTSTYSNGLVTTESTWRPTGAKRPAGIFGTDEQFLANIKLRTTGSKKATVSSLVAVDSFGLQIPIQFESVEPRFPIILLPGGLTKIVALMWIPGSLISDIDRFQAP